MLRCKYMKAILSKLHASDEQLKNLQRIYIRCTSVFLFGVVIYFLFLAVVIRSSDIVIGTDFRAFYTGGLMMRNGIGPHMYSLSQQYAWQKMVFPELRTQSWLLPFMNPPFVALFIIPLTLLPVKNAYIAWGLFQFVLLVLLVAFILYLFKKSRWQIRAGVATMVLIFFPILDSLREAQLSLLLTFALLFAWVLIRKKKYVFGGLCLSMLICKPYLLGIPIFLFLWKKPAVFLGILTGVLLFGLVSFLLVQASGLYAYMGLLKAVSSWNNLYGIHPKLEQSWNGLLMVLFQKTTSLYFLTWVMGDVIAVVVLFMSWRRVQFESALFNLQWALLVLVMIFVGPHVGYHDLSLLVVVGVAVGVFLSGKRRLLRFDWLLLAIVLSGYIAICTDYLFLYFRDLLHISTIFMGFALGILFYVLNAYPQKRLHEK